MSAIDLSIVPPHLLTPLLRRVFDQAFPEDLQTFEGLEALKDEIKSSRYPSRDEILRDLSVVIEWLRSARRPAPRSADKKSPAQLQREIDQALGTSSKKRRNSR